MKVPFLDLKIGYLELKEKLDAAYARFMESGWYVLGQEVDAFESEFANYCEAGHCVGVSNGLEALRIALEAAGIGSGDEVIVPSNTYIATWLAVSQIGAVPVPVEPDPDSFNIDPSRIGDAITPRTRAIIPVHLYGLSADMDPIMKLADRHGLFVLEDSAQAQGAGYNGRRTGSLGHAAAISFYPGKNLGAFGEAGAVVTSDAGLAERIRLLRNYGSEKKYYNKLKGHNSRIDGLQCAFLRAKLEVLDEWNARRRRIVGLYSDRLEGLDALVLPARFDGFESVWHQYVIRTTERDDLQAYLADAGVGTMIHYPIPPHHSEAYTEFANMSFPIAESLSGSVLSLPMSPHHTQDDIDYVAGCIRTFLEAF